MLHFSGSCWNISTLEVTWNSWNNGSKIGQNLKYQPATYYTHGRSQDIFEGWIKSKSNKSREIREQGYQNTTSKIYWPQELCTTLSHCKCVGMPLTVFGISLFYFSFFPTEPLLYRILFYIIILKSPIMDLELYSTVQYLVSEKKN